MAVTRFFAPVLSEILSVSLKGKWLNFNEQPPVQSQGILGCPFYNSLTSIELYRANLKVFIYTPYHSNYLIRHSIVIPGCVIPQISCVSCHACRDNIVMRSQDSAFATQAFETRNGAGKDKVIIFNFVLIKFT